MANTEPKGGKTTLHNAPGARIEKPSETLRTGDKPDGLIKGITEDFENRIADPTELPEEVAVPFTELAELLAQKDINLTKELNDQVQREIKRGYITAEQVEDYRKQFNTIHVRREEIENIQLGQTAILFVDNMTPEETAQKAIINANIGYYEYITLADFQRVNHHTGEPRKNQKPSGLARLTFTPNITNLTPEMTGKSPDHNLEQMKTGKRFLQPQQWFELFRRGLERAIQELGLSNGKAWKDLDKEEKQAILNNRNIDTYLPDENTWTQFPDWKNNSGRTLHLHWNPHYRIVNVSSGRNGIGYNNAGMRLASM